MKKGIFKKLFILVIILAVIFVAYKAVGFFREYFSDSAYVGETRSFSVSQGSTYKDIAQKLEDEGIIKSKYTFMVKYRLSADEYGELKFGEHKVEKGMSLDEIIKTIASDTPSLDTIAVTIPEGFSVDLIAQRMENHGLCTYEEFMEAVKKDVYEFEFLKLVPKKDNVYALEGFLFPDTYEFYESIDAEGIINTMLARFESIYLEEIGSYDDFYDIVTIASLIEREATLSSERPIISGVIYNRLKIDMLLQIDASVIYGKTLGKYDMEKVMNKDLEVESPYNIYKYKGLPPGPICNPGKGSIIAAANPDSHSYLYYHTDNKKSDGSHIFTETFDEHLQTMN